MTALLFRDDAYQASCEATIRSIAPNGGIVLDQTVFYAAAGGQPGDRGQLLGQNQSVGVATAVYDDTKSVVHIPASPETSLKPGDAVTVHLDWDIRYRNMRAHTLMHLLCAAVPYPVTGGAVTEDGGRIDFDIPDGGVPERSKLASKINGLIREDHPVSFRWISDEEMAASPHLVRTMTVKPPMGTGRVRLVAIGENGSLDLQPCGGTHVRSTGEIGPIAVGKMESKGKQNRRIRLVFA